MLLLLSCPAVEARPGELVVVVQEVGYIAQCSHCPVSQIAIQNVPSYFVFTVWFLSETWKICQLTHILFCLRLSLLSTYSGFICQFCCVAEWCTWKDVLQLVWSQGLAFRNHEEVLKFLFQGFWHVSMCTSSLKPKCLMPIGSFWSWYTWFSLWILTCCH